MAGVGRMSSVHPAVSGSGKSSVKERGGRGGRAAVRSYKGMAVVVGRVHSPLGMSGRRCTASSGVRMGGRRRRGDVQIAQSFRERKRLVWASSVVERLPGGGRFWGNAGGIERGGAVEEGASVHNEGGRAKTQGSRETIKGEWLAVERMAGASRRVQRVVSGALHDVTSSKRLAKLFEYGDTSELNFLAETIFLASNAAFPLASIVLLIVGGPSEYLLGTLTLLAGLASHLFHHSQVVKGPNRRTVKHALAFDYIAALSALLVGVVEVLESMPLPLEAVLMALVAGVFFVASSVKRRAITYMVTHAAWHISAAATAALIGLHHASSVI